MSNQTNHIKSLINAPFYRRLFALVYDSFVVFSFLILMTGLALAANQGQSLQPHQGLFLAYLFVCTALFVGWFWQRAGQTLGMLAWRIKVVNEDLTPLTWGTALKRFLVGTAAGGLGLLWCLFDKNKLALQDKLTKTRVVHLNQKVEKRIRKS
jgi:uncharacterized RDD family membrane protein YckC